MAKPSYYTKLRFIIWSLIFEVFCVLRWQYIYNVHACYELLEQFIVLSD